jgi:hypothetical protein
MKPCYKSTIQQEAEELLFFVLLAVPTICLAMDPCDTSPNLQRSGLAFGIGVELGAYNWGGSVTKRFPVPPVQLTYRTKRLCSPNQEENYYSQLTT